MPVDKLAEFTFTVDLKKALSFAFFSLFFFSLRKGYLVNKPFRRLVYQRIIHEDERLFKK